MARSSDRCILDEQRSSHVQNEQLNTLSGHSNEHRDEVLWLFKGTQPQAARSNQLNYSEITLSCICAVALLCLSTTVSY